MNGQAHVMRDPVELQNHLDGLVVELDSLSKEQDKWSTEQAAAQNAWEEVFDDFCERLQNEWNDGGHKGAFPGQERLESMARRELPESREAWKRLTRAEHMLEKRTRRASNVGKMIGGLQSTLKTLGTEASAAGSMR